MSANLRKRPQPDRPARDSGAGCRHRPVAAMARIVRDRAGRVVRLERPAKRMFGRIILVSVWLYVAALCAGPRPTFHWGIFGPTVPLVP